MRGISRLTGLGAVVLTSLLTAVLVLAFQNAAPLAAVNGSDQAEVHVTRAPGLLVLPALDFTITDPSLAARLATDIRSLPVAPSVCAGGVDYGTSYSLTFASPGTPNWTAVIAVFGCDEVTSATVRRAKFDRRHCGLISPRLWISLRMSFGRSRAEAQD